MREIEREKERVIARERCRETKEIGSEEVQACTV